MKSWKKKKKCVYVYVSYICMYVYYVYVYEFLVSSRGTRVGIPQGRSLSQGFANFKTKVC